MAFRALTLRQSLWRRANTRNVSLWTLYGGQFTFSTQLIVHVGRVNHSHCTKIQFFPCTGMLVNLGRSKRCPILGSNISNLTFNRRLSILDNKMWMCICHSILSTVARNGGQLPQSSGVKNVTPEYFIMIKEEDKNEVLGRIIEKLQNSPLFLDMKADLQVGFNYWFSYLTQITAAAKGMGKLASLGC